MEKAKRTLVIGDVHGCISELEELLVLARIANHDEIISVGDLVGKGPDSLAVLRWAMTDSRVRCVLGNHEARLLRAWQAGKTPREKASDADTYRQLGAAFEECMRFVSRWPLFIEEDTFAVVHAGIDPIEPNLARQTDRDLLTIRTLGDGETPWFEDYRGNKLVLFGHTARPSPLERPNALGLDTGCVYGGSLTGVLLPERKLISVPARRAYREKKDWPVRKSQLLA